MIFLKLLNSQVSYDESLNEREMKNKYIYLALALITVVSITFYYIMSSWNDQMKKLILEIEMDKSTNQFNNPIFVIVRLKNLGDDPVTVNGRMSVNYPNAPDALRDITFIVTDPNGEPVSFKASVNIRPPEKEDILVLSPGEMIEKKYNIVILYSIEEIGSYSAYAIYHNSFETDHNILTWKGELPSNIVRFEVTP